MAGLVAKALSWEANGVTGRDAQRTTGVEIKEDRKRRG
jgi:hypothetical protein